MMDAFCKYIHSVFYYFYNKNQYFIYPNSVINNVYSNEIKPKWEDHERNYMEKIVKFYFFIGVFMILVITILDFMNYNGNVSYGFIVLLRSTFLLAAVLPFLITKTNIINKYYSFFLIKLSILLTSYFAMIFQTIYQSLDSIIPWCYPYIMVALNCVGLRIGKAITILYVLVSISTILFIEIYYGRLDLNSEIGVVFFVFFVCYNLSTRTDDDASVFINNYEIIKFKEENEAKLRENALELSEALEKLKSAQADLVQSEKLASIGTLAAGIAHEVNNSLNYVNNGFDGIKMVFTKLEIPEDKKKKIETMVTLVQNGLDITTSIIQNMKIASSATTISEYIDVNTCINASVTLLNHKIKGGNIEVINNIPEKLTIYAIKVGLIQIFMNLITNAVDALVEANKKNGQIKFESMQNDDEIHINIIDNGVGIPKEIIERIFDPFFTTKELGKGTGLGLHIVRSEMEKMSGKVKVYSEENVGTTFTLIFKRSA